MRPFPDIEAFEERAAVAEHEGGLSRRQAETLPARDQGFRVADGYWAWLSDSVISGRAPR